MKRNFTLILIAFLFLAGCAAQPIEVAYRSSVGSSGPLEQFKQKEIPADKTISIYAVGDIMMSRYIGKVMAKKQSATYDGSGIHYPFKEITDKLFEADIVFGNLESVIGLKTEDDKPYYSKPYNFLAHPDTALALKHAGFDVLSLANNHAMDYGPKRITETRLVLDTIGIKYFGAGINEGSAREPAVITHNGMTVAFLGYGNGHSSDIYATATKAGTARIVSENILADIEKAKQSADIVLVSLHWGFEYEDTPKNWQRVMAKKLIDYGADAILGHHPHILQGIEIYKGKPIVYSLGNFLFDQKKGKTTGGMIVELKFEDKKYKGITVIPLDRFNTYYPKVALGKKKKTALKEIYDISLPINENKKALAFLGVGAEKPVKLAKKKTPVKKIP